MAGRNGSVVAVVAAALIVIGTVEPFYLRMLVLDRERYGAFATELPYHKLPGLRLFLLELRQQTRRGDRIAMDAPFQTWNGGYDYYYARSLYTLSGRDVLPLRGPDDHPIPQNLERAEYVASWRSAPQLRGFAIIWRGRDGVLQRRVH
jgi:hypothetical protein